MVDRILAFLVLFCLTIGSVCAQAPPVGAPAHPLGPGDPLPKIILKSEGATTFVKDKDGNYWMQIANVVFTMGDLKIQADELKYTVALEHLEARGHVVISRGDETLHGSSFILDGQTAEFTADDAQLASPPLFLHAERLFRSTTDLLATNARISTGAADGSGELQFLAREAELTPDQTLHLRNVGISLYGLRIFTLNRLTIRLGSDENGNPVTRGGGGAPPVTLRNSQISGFVFGLNLPFKIRSGLTSRVDIDESTRQGLEYALNLRQTLYSRRGARGRSPLRLRQSTPFASNPSTFGESQLRQLLTARLPELPPDPILDYTNITPTPDPLALPTRNQSTDLHIDLNLTHNREIGSLRQGPVLVSRQPEIVLAGRLPLTYVPIPDDDGAARSALRRLRFALTGEIDEGRYEETQLTNGRTHVNADRFGMIGGITTLPLLVGSRILMLAQSTIRNYRYQGGNDYHYVETRVNSDYIFGIRTALGVSYITRALDGSTPFVFDQVDTQDEGQLRAETRFGPNGSYTFSALERYDVGQRRFFDSQIAVAIRGHNIEPRFSYTYLNRQFSINVGLPGITAP